eukprot:1139732-Pelagomonas_calceolata.AAC.4
MQKLLFPESWLEPAVATRTAPWCPAQRLGNAMAIPTHSSLHANPPFHSAVKCNDDGGALLCIGQQLGK